jgi:hypothetical protein
MYIAYATTFEDTEQVCNFSTKSFDCGILLCRPLFAMHVPKGLRIITGVAPTSTDVCHIIPCAVPVRCPPLVDGRHPPRDATDAGETKSLICGFAILLMQYLQLVGQPESILLYMYFSFRLILSADVDQLVDKLHCY